MLVKRMPWTKNHKCERPSRLLFVDTETVGQPSESYPGHIAHTLRLGVASSWIRRKTYWHRVETKRFTSSGEFWEFAYDHLRNRRPTWCYGHNIAFDFTILSGWSQLDRSVLRVIETSGKSGNTSGPNNAAAKTWRGKTALDGTPFILETRHDRGPLKFVDSYNYWPVPLSKLGKWMEHRKLEFPQWDSDTEDQFQYCQRDVEIVEKAVLSLMDLWENENLGNWQPTIASLAYSSYRHGKEESQIVAHGDEELSDEDRANYAGTTGFTPMDGRAITDVERRCYYGGRTAVYFFGDIRPGTSKEFGGRDDLFTGWRAQIPGPVTVVDVNSLYPYVMHEYLHPIEILDAIKTPSFQVACKLIEQFPCCADVQLTGAKHDFPRRTQGKLTFCRGNFNTSLCGEELLYAVTTGCVKAIVNLCVYNYGRPFRNFVQYWSGRRESFLNSGRLIEARFCKDVMNSLYGKLAQKTPLWQTCGLTIPPVRWGSYIGQPSPGEKPCLMRAIAGVSQYQSPPRNCRHTFVAGAASVTASARQYMRRLTALCPDRSIVYTDTDSLFCLPPAMESLENAGLIHPTELGKLKIKGTYQTVRLWGQKDYEIDGIQVIAGLRSDARQISERLWDQVNFEGITQIIQHEPDDTILQRDVRFMPSVNIPATKVGWDGWCESVELD